MTEGDGGGTGDDGTGTESGGGVGNGGNGSSGQGAPGASAKWRCTWCGKPHEKNDPPCENCGHHKFEKAVVPVAPDPGEDYQREPVWVCTECGRQHQKHSPPCSRCGNATLERRIPDEDDYASELGGTSYFDILEPRYVLGLAFAAVAGAVLVLAALGVVTLPGMGGGSLDVANVPGDATSVDGVSLSDTESALVDELDERRAARDLPPLERHDRLGAISRFGNQRLVKATYTDAEMPSGERLAEELGRVCDGDVATLQVSYGAEETSTGRLADSPDGLASQVLAESAGQADAFAEPGVSRVGVDVHAGPEDRLHVVAFGC